jgi:heptosyltransferase-1
MLPVETLAKVADGIVGLSGAVVLAWGPGERDKAAAVVAPAGPQVKLAPPTDLEQLVLLLGGASLVVGGDTGPVHLAASLGVPTLAVFTATDWQRNGPLGPRVDVVSGVSSTSRGPVSSAHAPPVRTITADEVVERAARLLDEGSS